MRNFLLKISIALGLALIAHLFAGFFADGSTDDHYLRFTGDRRASLILGTSRAAQGLRPEVMQPLLPSAMQQGQLFNFAFTIEDSPYGRDYLRALEAKLATDGTNGLFIVAVDPWSLSNVTDKKDHKGGKPGTGLDLIHQWTFNSTPNYEYLAKHLGAGWGSLIGGPLRDPDTLSFLHEDGWLEIRAPLDSATVHKRTSRKAEYYRDLMLPSYSPSNERIEALEQILDLLRSHGKVYMVRLPIGNAIAEIEDQLWPSFNERMERIANGRGVPYWDMLPQAREYSFTDGNHLDTTSARMLSEDLAVRIAEYR